MSVNRLRLHGARGMSVLELLMALSVIGIASGIAFASVERNVSATREPARRVRSRCACVRRVSKRSSVPRRVACTSSRRPARPRSAPMSMATAMA